MNENLFISFFDRRNRKSIEKRIYKIDHKMKKRMFLGGTWLRNENPIK